jgi:hypothetical protein
MEIFDLAIAYKWKFDKEFVDLIEERFQRSGLSTFIIANYNISEVIELLKTKKIGFKACLDRASDEDPNFLPIAKILSRKKCYIINPHYKIVRSIDKTAMHKKLLKKKLQVPKTYLLSSFDKDEYLHLTEDDLDEIDRPFIVKPALFTGGGEGVLRNCESLIQIQDERIKNHANKYLVQEIVYPRTLHAKRAWFRIIYAFGHVLQTWWDDRTHIYFRVTKNEIKKYNLLPLSRISQRLARITQLDYFSTEIALTKDHKFILIDYINDQCDMRLKSNHPDGVPDEIVSEFIERMKRKVLSL